MNSKNTQRSGSYSTNRHFVKAANLHPESGSAHTSSRNLRTFGATMKTILTICVLIACCAGLKAQSTINPPVDGAFDWAGRARTLQVVIDNTPQKDGDGKVIVPGADSFQVAPCPPEGDEVQSTGTCKPTKVAGYDCPYIEGNAGKGCPAFTIGQAMRRAMKAWNAAKTGWTLDENAQKVPVITVRMSKAAIGNQAEELTPIIEILPLNDYGSLPKYVPRIDNPRPDPNEPNAATNVLAVFRCLDKPDKLGVIKDCSNAEIVFNRNVKWGISKLNVNGDTFYDPIVTALHEVGHAFRLDHDSPGFSLRPDLNNGIAIVLHAIVANNGQVNKTDGLIMRAGSEMGVHNINPTDPTDLSKDFARNPLGPNGGGKANTDTNAAAASATAPIQK